MDIQNNIYKLADSLQTPFRKLDNQMIKLEKQKPSVTITIKKVAMFALTLLTLPATGLLYLTGKGIEKLINAKIRKYNPEQITTVHEPASSEKVENSFFMQFQERANALYRAQTFAPKKVLPTPSEETINVISEADNKRYYHEKPDQMPEGVKTIRAGLHFCFFYDGMPDVVFKTNATTYRAGKISGYTKEQAEDYVKQSNLAHELCNKDGFYLLQVPHSKAVKLPNGNYAIMQERVDIHHDWRFQRGLYRRLLDTPATKDYINELHRQLAVFIAKFKFSDVKYNNIPITKEGYVALFDLDTVGAACGFLSGGCMGKEDGLLSDLPHTMQRQMIEAARDFLSADEYNKINAAMEKKKTLSEKRWGKVHQYYQFATRHQIQTSDQKILLKPIHFSSLNLEEKKIAEELVQLLNEKISEKKDWPSLREARHIKIEVGKNSNFYQSVEHFLAGHDRFLSIVDKVVEHLTTIGVVHSTTQRHNGSELTIYC